MRELSRYVPQGYLIETGDKSGNVVLISASPARRAHSAHELQALYLIVSYLIVDKDLTPCLYCAPQMGFGSPLASVGTFPRKELPVQMVDATLAWSLSAGVSKPKVFLGR